MYNIYISKVKYSILVEQTVSAEVANVTTPPLTEMEGLQLI